jgi:hypothetical protein
MVCVSMALRPLGLRNAGLVDSARTAVSALERKVVSFRMERFSENGYRVGWRCLTVATLGQSQD